ncbi:MAG TPA: prephenate dehydratase [Candidatus Binatia bacterium]|nr:prephenate dehydratase [Candidatus Binatia bacterium]
MNRPVAYSGEPGAFAEDAVVAAFGEGAERLSVGGFREAFEAVADGRAGAAVLPIENLVNGSIRETYDLLLEFDHEIVREVVVPVALCLAAASGVRIEDVVRVYSHIQALGQAERFLRGRPWALLTTYNTAGAGKLIAHSGEPGAAAVLSRRAAERFGLTILAEGIQDVPDNRTRFVVTALRAPGQPAPVDGTPYRTTVAFGVRNEPGTLLAALRVFAARGINLSKLESRPSRTAAWEYVFWADLDAHQDDPECAAALSDLAACTTMIRVFGSYERAS